MNWREDPYISDLNKQRLERGEAELARRREQRARVARLTAQPIHDDGSIGFDNANPITCEGASIAEVFALMANDLTAYPEHTAWDLTLEVRTEP